MFYILNFKNHDFISCDNANIVETRINEMLALGYNADSLEIVNGFGEDARFSISEFKDYCKEWSLTDNSAVTSKNIDSEGIDKNQLSESERRLEAVNSYKKNKELLENEAEKQKQEKADDLISQIKSLEPRINELIAVGNACLQNNIPLTGQAFGAVESYKTNQFFTNSWSHLVGFVGNPHRHPCYIEFLGINAGGACGSYDFRTDGNRVFSVHEHKPCDIIAPSIGHMERFLNCFEEFETSFFSYVDQVIEKQQRSVDKLIALAQEKQSMQNTSFIQEQNKIENLRG